MVGPKTLGAQPVGAQLGAPPRALKRSRETAEFAAGTPAVRRNPFLFTYTTKAAKSTMNIVPVVRMGMKWAFCFLGG
jgi:hypothetical protein